MIGANVPLNYKYRINIMLKTLSLAAVIAVTASASFAGSLNTTYENPVDDQQGVFVPNTGSGIGAPAVIGGALAVIAIAALVSNSNDDEAVDGHGSTAAAD
jgi:hypothetical protein